MSCLGRVEADLLSRQRRQRLFPRELFADPAWDLLLGLYHARLSDQTVTLAEACSLASVPTNSALRWILVLERQGLVEETGTEDERDAARVELTPQALECLRAYFEAG